MQANNKAQIISSSIRNKTPGKTGSLFAKWERTGGITEIVLPATQERRGIKQGNVAVQVDAPPWPYNPGCSIPPGMGPCRPAAPSGTTVVHLARVCCGSGGCATPHVGAGSCSCGFATAMQAGLCVQSGVRRANVSSLSPFRFSPSLITDPTYRPRTERSSP